MNMRSRQDRLRTFLFIDVVTAGAAVMWIVLVWAFAHRSGWLLVLAAMVGASGLVMLLALPPLRRNDLVIAVRWLAVANWAIALASTAVATFAWPLMVLAALLPAVFATPYATGRELRLYLVVSLAVSIGVAALGLLQDFSGLTDDLPSWVPPAVVIFFTPFLGAMIAQLGLSNALRLQGLLAEALETNERLRASEDALVRHAEDLRVSRVRLVAATDRERRRIERDLHDGAQQRLVGLGVGLSLARELVRSDPDAALDALTALRAEVAAAQAELRDLAQGVYPPVLTEHGLAEALRSAVDRVPQPVSVVIEDVARQPPDLEAAVYFCCVEALQNVAKHAGPEATVQVRLAFADGMLCFEVRDDGRGFEIGNGSMGNGFTNMEDRLGAAGGALEIVSAPGTGTSVAGRVPTSAT